MSYDVVPESVPPFVKRVGDQVFQGSNNTLIVFGTDRAANGPAKKTDGLGHVNAPDSGRGAGTLHFIVGRKDPEGNPDLKSDSSYLYVTAKSNVDENLGLDSVESNVKKTPGVILKSDTLRIVYRKDLKVCLHDGKNYIYMNEGKVTVKVSDNFISLDGKAANVEVGPTKVRLDGKSLELKNGNVSLTATSSLVKVNSPSLKITGGCEKPWKDLFSSLSDFISKHDHTTPAGPSGAASTGVVTLSQQLETKLTVAKSSWESSSTGD